MTPEVYHRVKSGENGAREAVVLEERIDAWYRTLPSHLRLDLDDLQTHEKIVAQVDLDLKVYFYLLQGQAVVSLYCILLGIRSAAGNEAAITKLLSVMNNCIQVLRVSFSSLDSYRNEQIQTQSFAAQIYAANMLLRAKIELAELEEQSDRLRDMVAAARELGAPSMHGQLLAYMRRLDKESMTTGDETVGERLGQRPEHVNLHGRDTLATSSQSFTRSGTAVMQTS